MNFLSSVEQILRKHLSILDFRFDSLQGPLPTPPQAMHFFLISNNELVGEIPSKICNLSFLSVLDLSTNNLGGTIPDCLKNFSIQRSMVILGTVNLNVNQLEGSIPQSLKNCHSKLPHLQVLVLRSNRFHGDIQNFNGTFSFSSLRMIDLSQNEFTGHIPPELFENLKSMKDMQVDESGPEYIRLDYYQDSVIITMKGSDFELERILTFFIVVDFSSNHFKGSIPKEVGELNSLIVLNFSHNRLASNIPPSLGKMTALESLDLSSNKLQGRILVQLTDLKNLGELNLSHNNLEGQILLDNHFDTFSNDSFDGNFGLCGFPFNGLWKWTSAWIEYGIHSFHNWETPLASEDDQAKPTKEKKDPNGRRKN
ncbi:receptor like protein 26-like [Gossypium arboreum]|uniref:receptor like protein 26-like n=1 Tax=Gossypium arboreum TaxID=29729 RepID=UPI0008194938|nr:receptor like protein 26-like [Gossypium arboreum]